MADNLIAELNSLLTKLFNEQAALRHDLRLLQHEIRDIKSLITKSTFSTANRFNVITSSKIAVESWDHKQPRGVAGDNTRCPWFVSAVESLFNHRRILHLDLGCAGGGLVYDFLLRGHESIGIEGSDYLERTKGGHWMIVPNNLFTADITKPFTVQQKGGGRARFDVITAMEVMEHIPEQLLDGMMENVWDHLSDDGYFCCSIATFPDFDKSTGAVWHVTLKDKEWWTQKFASNRLFVDNSNSIDARDFPRGTMNPLAGYGADNDFLRNPSLGFHLTLRKE